MIADMDFQKGLNQIEYRMKLDPLGIEFEFSVIIQCTYWTHMVELKELIWNYQILKLNQK